MSKKLNTGSEGDHSFNPNSIKSSGNGDSDLCDDACIEQNPRVRHTQITAVVLFVLAALLALWCYLNFLCVSNLGSENSTANWLLEMFYGNRCRKAQTTIGLPNVIGDSQRLSLNGTTITLDNGSSIDLAAIITASSLSLASVNGSDGATGVAGLNGASGAPGAMGPAGPPAPPGGGTLDQAYNFGGPALGRVINAGTNVPVAVRVPVGFGINSGLEVTGDGGLGNSASSGMMFSRYNLGGPQASTAIVYSENLVSPLTGIFGFNGFTGTPGAEAFNFGLINSSLTPIGILNFDVGGTSIGAGDSQSIAGNGLNVSISSGDGGSTSGDGGSVYISTGSATTIGNGGLMYLQTGSGNGGGNGGDFGIATSGGGAGGSINISTGTGITSNGGHFYMNLGSGNGIGGSAMMNMGSSNTAGGNFQLNGGYGSTNGGAVVLSAGGSDNLGGSLYLISGNSTSAGSTAGDLIFSGGNSPYAVGTNGGGLDFYGGIGGVGGSFNVYGGFGFTDGGDVNMSGGMGENGGEVNIGGGYGYNGGTINLTAGSSGHPGGIDIPGDINITAGSGEDNSGDIDVIAGNSIGGLGGEIEVISGTGLIGGGSLILNAGTSLPGSGGYGGEVQINAGVGEGGGGGTVNISAGSDLTSSGGDVSLTAGNGPSGGGDVTLVAGTGFTNGNVVFWTSGSERGRFDASGQFLVNTTAPVVGKVAVFNGDIDVTGVIDPTALLFSDTTGLSSYDPIVNNGYRIGVTGLTQRPIFISPMVDSTGVFEVRNASNLATIFSVDTLNQRVGIGTTTPTQMLDVAGDGLINGLTLGRGEGNDITNSVFGQNALAVNTGYWNTAIGSQALASNTTATRNTAIGWNTLAANSTGNSNTAVGGNVLALNTTGFQNTAIGRGAMQANLTGGNNNAIGVLALGQQTTGFNNVAIGNSAMNVANGSNNVVIGVLASITQSTASNNTIIGYNTGGGLTTGGANTIIGSGVNGLAGATANNIIIADGSGNRRINVISNGNTGIGTTSPGTFRLNVTDTTTTNVAQFNGSVGTQCTVVTGTGWSCTSDETLKTNILNITNGINVINQIQGVTYNWKDDPTGTQQDGFIAQDIQKILPELVSTDSNGKLSLNKDGIMPYIVEAVKEQNGDINKVNQQLGEQGVQLVSISDQLRVLSKRVDEVESEIERLKDTNKKQLEINSQLEERLRKLEGNI